MNTNIKEAGFFKRLLAYLIDGGLVVVTTMILYNTVTANYMFDSMGGNERYDEFFSFCEDSHLIGMTKDSSGKNTGINYLMYNADENASGSSSSTSTTTTQTVAGYTYYLDAIWSYYTDFVPTDTRTTKFFTSITTGGVTTNVPFEKADYYSYVCTTLFSLPTIDEANTSGNGGSDKNTYFVYDKNPEGKFDNTLKPVINDTYKAKVAATDTATAAKTELQNYFFNTSGTTYSGVYYNAVLNLQGNDKTDFSQSYYTEKSGEVGYLQWLCLIVVFIPLQLIFFLLLPILSKNGMSLGKRLTSIAVVDLAGYSMRLPTRILRALIMTLLGMLLVVPTSYQLIGIGIYIIICLIDYMTLVVSKTHQSLHDKICHTIGIDAKNSKWFKNQEEEQDYLAEHPTNDAGEPVDPILQAENDRIAREDAILDLSTINRNREEAGNMVNFDEYEKNKEEEQKRRSDELAKTMPEKKKVNLTKEDDVPETTTDEPDGGKGAK